MSNLGEVSKQVERIQRDALTGVLMVTGSGPSVPGPVTYTMRFEQGELTRASGGGQLKGLAAVEYLCRCEQLTQLRWMALSPVSSGTAEPELPAKWLAKKLREAAIAQVSLAASANDDLSALLERVESVFLQFYVGDTKADLAALSKSHPPDRDVTAYLDECVHLLTPWIGEKEARRLIKA